MARKAHIGPAVVFKHALPLLFAAGLAFGIPYLSTELLGLAARVALLPAQGSWQWLYLHHGAQLGLALIAIAIVRRYAPADYGLHLPRGKTYIGVAIVGGLSFALIASVVAYGPSLIAHRAPTLGYAPSTANVVGWLTFEGVYVGPTEEIPFRALLVTYLAATIPGRVRLLGRELSIGAVIAAALFGLSHWNYGVLPFPLALGQQAYAFALGLFYAYCLEKSRSVLAPILAHNISDVFVTALGLLLFLFLR
jgi:membrane protease YdiL (CAAX protease family)